jgi:hypothetical protein
MTQQVATGAYEAIRDFVINEAKYAEAKANYNAARKTLLALLPKEIGEFELKEAGFTVMVKYPEKADWNAESLEALYGSDKPAHVKASYSIDLRVLRGLPESEREQLKSCYQLVPGTPSIAIEKDA